MNNLDHLTKLHVSELVIEVTRRCNLSCGHCLRGPQEDHKFDLRTLRALKEGLTSIGSLVLTGGEPGMAIPTMEGIRRSLAWADGPSIEGFFLATNGTINQQALAVELLCWYAIVMEHTQGDEGAFSFRISDTLYHKESLAEEHYEEMKWSPLHGITGREKPSEWDAKARIAKEGRGINIPGSEPNTEDTLNNGIYHRGDTLSAEDAVIYINVFGDVILGCNWSYESQKYHTIGSLKTHTLLDILKNHVLKEEIEIL